MDETSAPPPANRLAAETSAYLRQHMHNPVDWHPWGEEALGTRARERQAAARLDRLQRLPLVPRDGARVVRGRRDRGADEPALRQREGRSRGAAGRRPIYMERSWCSRGHGGWPLTVFCTPDGRPFYGGTYFPPEPRHGLPSFRQVLRRRRRAPGATQRGEVEAERGDRSSRRSRGGRRASRTSRPARTALARGRAARCSQGADARARRLRRRAEVPDADQPRRCCSRRSTCCPQRKAQDALESRRASRAARWRARGLYDQLGGGFHRYCVDATLDRPALREDALRPGPAPARLRRSVAPQRRRRRRAGVAGARDRRPTCAARCARPTAASSRARTPTARARRAVYYVWTPAADRERARRRARATRSARAYGVTRARQLRARHDAARRRARGAPRARFAAERAQLLAVRARSACRPATDRKRVAAWNALAISGLARAGSAARRRRDARRRRSPPPTSCSTRMRDDGGPPRARLRRGHARTSPAFLDDVAALLEAALDLHRAGAGERFLDAALRARRGRRDALLRRGARAISSSRLPTASRSCTGRAPITTARRPTRRASPRSACCARRRSPGARDLARDRGARAARRTRSLLERAPAGVPDARARRARWRSAGSAVAVVIGDAGRRRRRARSPRARAACSRRRTPCSCVPRRAHTRRRRSIPLARGPRAAIGGRATA